MISVLVPVRNAAPWIEESLRSIADQTVQPDEILVADDASTDGTADLVESLAIPRLRVLRTEDNRGISWQLNRLIAEAHGRWLARMDGDDISMPDRLETQLLHMRSHGLAVCGTWCRRFGSADTRHHFATRDAEIKSGLLFSVPFCHPSVVFDREILGGNLRYDPEFDVAEDYHLWTRLRFAGAYGNVPRELLRWRMHQSNAGTAPASQGVQKTRASKVRDLLLAEYGIRLAPEARNALEDRARSTTLDRSGNARFLEVLAEVSRLPESVIQADRGALRQVLVAQWDLSCLFSAWRSPGVFGDWWRGRRSLGAGPSPRIASKIALKSFVGRIRRG